jgi:hypothetical protein
MVVLAQSSIPCSAPILKGWGLCLFAASVLMGPVSAVANPPPPTPSPSALPLMAPAPAPAWAELDAEQQSALAPLAPYWNQLGPQRKRKWLAVSNHFNQLSEEEKAKLHDRMTDWVQLSAQERNQARLNFAAAPKLSNDEKLAHWQAYQSLSPQDRQVFIQRAQPKPAGAATVIKPVPAQKLTPQPDASRAPTSTPAPLAKIKDTAKIEANPSLLNSHTLLRKTQ